MVDKRLKSIRFLDFPGIDNTFEYTFESNQGGLSDRVKTAILECFAHVAFLDNDEDYYGILKNALRTDDEINSISAVFSQNNNVISSTDELDYLRSFLVVTAHYKDGTESVVTEYTLSGELGSGTSTITVSYRGRIATFNVIVKQLPSGYTKKNYIESNGSQYINTGIVESQAGNYSYKTKVMPFIPDISERMVSHLLSSQNYFVIVFRHETDLTNWFTANRWGGTLSNIDGEAADWNPNQIYTIESHDGFIYLNDKKIISYENGSTKTDNNVMHLLGYSAQPNNDYFRYKGRLYYMKICNDNTNEKVHDYIPCVNSNSVVGVYDMVSDQFLQPTVGTLIAG